MSFIVPAYNEEPLIARTLQALKDAGTAVGEPFEVVVADDASTDRTAAIAHEHGARVVSVRNRQIAATRNAGAKAATGEMLIFVDADTVVTPAAVRAAVDAMRAGAAGGGCALRFDGEVPLYGRIIQKTFVPLYRLFRMASGCFLFCTRQAFHGTGGFDERMFAAEELAMSRALYRQGRFVVLRECLTTSGRRLRAYSGREVLGLLPRLALSGEKGLGSGSRWIRGTKGADLTPGRENHRGDERIGMQPETTYARSPEGHVAFQVVGDGPRDLVFVPDWCTNLDLMWEEPSLARFLRRLGSFSRLICFDKRGTGTSDPVPLRSLPTLEQWMDDVGTVMAAAGSRRTAVFGHAEGGPMAILFAATFPDRTSALILGDTFARLLRADDYPCGLPRSSVPKFLATFEKLWGTGGNVEFIAPSMADSPSFRLWRARYERCAMGPGAATGTYATMFDIDVRPVLSAIRVPTLVMHRADNGFTRVEHGRYLAEHIPGAKYVELPGRDHLYHAAGGEPLLDEVQEFLTGAREVSDQNRVLATILFTDIVGSTERAVALGDRAWRDLLDHHNILVRREIERWRGREVKIAGDGFLATFDGPARAVRCAINIRDVVEQLGIQVRAGLHTGECEVMGDDVTGLAVHIGARVAATAGPREVLVSSTVKDLVAGSGIQFLERGTHVLKGVPNEWQLFAAGGGMAI